MTNFEKWDREFRTQNLFAFNYDETALLWLKVRAICRGKQIEQFCLENNITLKSTKIAQKNIELFTYLEQIPNAMDLLDRYLCVKSHDYYDSMGINEARLKEDLYKIQYYKRGEKR